MIKSDSTNSISSNQTKQKLTVLTPPPIPTTSRHDFAQEFQEKRNQERYGSDTIDATKIDNSSERSELLKSICSFKRGELRKVNSN